MKAKRNFWLRILVFEMMLGVWSVVGWSPAMCADSIGIGRRSPRPIIEFESTTIDMGQSASGKNVSKDIVFRNKGDATLVIERIQSG